MFKEVNEVSIDSKSKKISIGSRRFVNPESVDFIEEERTEDEKNPVIYKLNIGNKKLTVSAKDFQSISGNEVSNILPDGSYKTK